MSPKHRARVAPATLATFMRFVGPAALLALAWAPSPYAEAATVPPDVTLADALRAAAEHNPALRASAFDVLALEGRRQQARARPNPELTLELENFAGSGEVSGTDALESTLALSQLIELGDKRSSRVASWRASSTWSVSRSTYAVSTCKRR